MAENLPSFGMRKSPEQSWFPTNLGTGLRASVMLHLPILEGSGNLGTLADSVSKIGLTVRGMYGEGSKSAASLYQVSNQVTLGISEEEIITSLENIVKQIEKQYSVQILLNKLVKIGKKWTIIAKRLACKWLLLCSTLAKCRNLAALYTCKFFGEPQSSRSATEYAYSDFFHIFQASL